jgi:transposase
VKHRIARKGVESTTKLGRHRWIVERTLPRLDRYRRLTIRYERLVAVCRGLLHLACCLIRWSYVRRLCNVQ